MDTFPVILLHGALGAKTQMAPIAAALEQQHREIHAINFSGHNGEPFSAEGFGIEIFAADVLAFLNKHNLPKVDVFGYSMGGYVALWLAHLHPERFNRIITLGTKFDWDAASAERETRKLNPDKIIEKVPAFARVLEMRHKPADWKTLMQKTSQMMLRLGAEPLLTESILKSIMIPVDIYLGDLDDMADRAYSERMAALLPRGRFFLLPDTPHPIEKTTFIPFA